MTLHVFHRRSQLPHPVERVFDWHLRPGAVRRLLPPWEPVELRDHEAAGKEGTRAEFRLRIGPVPVTWIAEHREYVPNRQFKDVQIAGPFARWEHTHRFEPVDSAASLLEDRIEYELPLDPLSSSIGGRAVTDRLSRMFDFRHRVTARDLALHSDLEFGGPRSVVVSGASGLVGSTLRTVLSTGGHRPIPLVRAPRDPSHGAEGTGQDPSTEGIGWDPGMGWIDAGSLDGVDTVVHLAGEPIASRRWSKEQRTAIRDSRVSGTRLLAETVAAMKRPPEALICASATGWYGDRGDEPLSEDRGPGSGFLADVCREWEAAAEPAREAGIRVVHLRFGMILWPSGGALPKMLPPFRAGAGGRTGSGRQFWSWISLDDAIGAILHAAATEALNGPVNVVSPHPVRNAEFASVLGAVLGRPALVPAPAGALRLALGRMADELLLSSARVIPTRLEESGFRFRDPDLESALRHMLGRQAG